RGVAEDRHVRTEPVDDHPLNPPADHVDYLLMHLRRIVGTVAYVHMVRSAKPRQPVDKYLRGRSRIEQGIHRDFAYVPSRGVPLALGRKTVRRAGVVAGFGLQCGGGSDRRSLTRLLTEA